jgi:hypothetical protein
MATRRLLALTLMLVAMTLLGATSTTPLAANEGGDHHGHYMACAKACAECALQCDSCFHHCKEKALSGSKEHARSMQICVDCAEFCRLGATLAARHSPLAVNGCEACARACDDCATACETFKDDKHMAECAKSCRDCARACREMVKMVKQ